MRGSSVWRIARWEVARSAGEIDRRVVLGIVAVLVVLAALAPALAAGGASPDRGIYRVAVADSSPYYPAVRGDDRLRVVPPGENAVDSGRADLAIRRGSGRDLRGAVADSPKGRAALAAFREAVVASNDRRMRSEPDQAAAFPVSVSLEYVEPADFSPEGDGTGGDGDASGDGTTTTTTAASGGEESGGGLLDGLGDLGGLGGAIRGAGQAFLGGPQSGTPADISPPFPLRSLVLAFAFVLPLNVVAQAYGSTMMGERIDRRGEPLLVAPVSALEIVAGKTLPYLLAALAATVAVAVLVGAGLLSVLAVLPIVLLFLACTFVAALFARSFKELTFLTVTVSVLITAYVFVPAVFTDVHPIAAISPLSVVVRDLTGAGVDAGTLAFATLPMGLAAAVLFGLGGGIYREEDLFTQRPPGAKALDALAAHLTARRVPLWSALAIPFVFVAELFAVALLFVLPVALSLPILLAVLAIIEEVAKSLHVYAGVERGRLPRTTRAALLAGVGSGAGFAVGEKALLASQVVGLPDLDLGRVAFAPAAATDPVVLAGLLVAPFALHALTATLSALGATRSRTGYAVGLFAAVVVHLLYNLGVVAVVGAGA